MGNSYGHDKSMKIPRQWVSIWYIRHFGWRKKQGWGGVLDFRSEGGWFTCSWGRAAHTRQTVLLGNPETLGRSGHPAHRRLPEALLCYYTSFRLGWGSVLRSFWSRFFFVWISWVGKGGGSEVVSPSFLNKQPKINIPKCSFRVALLFK